MGGKVLVPNEQGVYVPSDCDGTEPAEMSESERVLSLAANGGGSGTGMSYYSVAARCGRKARLSTERQAQYAGSDVPLPPTKNHFVIGSVYHKLHELARSNNALPTIDLNERWRNPSVAEGVRLYRGWLRTWGVNFWGRCLGVEVKFKDNKTFRSKDLPNVMFDHLGDVYDNLNAIEVTAALDMVVEMDEAACERAKRRGLDLKPGRRVVDWKSADGPSNGVQYAEGLQALWYAYVWNKHNPQQPVDGVIFDVVMKRSRRKDRTVLPEDFQAFYVPCGLEDVDALRGMVLQGHENVMNDRANRAECVDWRGDVCPYRLSGECDAK